jgi:flagellar basal body-associated protein FliL
VLSSSLLGSPSRSSGSTKILPLIAVAALLGGAAVYLLQGRSDADADTPESEPPSSPAIVYEIGNFLVNVKSAGDLRYLRVEVAAAISDYRPRTDGVARAGGNGHGDEQSSAGGSDEPGQLPPLSAEDQARARDLVVRILSEAGFNNLRDDAGREKVKQQIRQALDKAIKCDEVEQVLFVSFVMQ